MLPGPKKSTYFMTYRYKKRYKNIFLSLLDFSKIWNSKLALNTPKAFKFRIDNKHLPRNKNILYTL